MGFTPEVKFSMVKELNKYCSKFSISKFCIHNTCFWLIILCIQFSFCVSKKIKICQKCNSKFCWDIYTFHWCLFTTANTSKALYFTIWWGHTCYVKIFRIKTEKKQTRQIELDSCLNKQISGGFIKENFPVKCYSVQCTLLFFVIFCNFLPFMNRTYTEHNEWKNINMETTL